MAHRIEQIDVDIPHKFTPWKHQRGFFGAMERGVKRAFKVWHRRSGKDKTDWNFMIREAFKKVAQYFYVFPTLSQGRKAIWEGIDSNGMRFLDHIPKDAIDGEPNNSEMKIRLKNGSIIQLQGTDNNRYEAMRGTNPYGFVFSEWPRQNSAAWTQVASPILRANDGWAVFNGTPNGKNHAYDLFEIVKELDSWYVSLLTINDTFREDGTPIVTEADLDEDRALGMSEDDIQQEYYCSWDRGIEGAYYARLLQHAELEGRVTHVPYDPILTVDTFWDLGIDDHTAIWFMQRAGIEYRFINYIEHSNEGLHYYAQRMQKLEYNYGTHYFPHDAEARQQGTADTPKRLAQGMGIKPIIIVPRSNPLDRVQSVRAVLPLCWFDINNTSAGLDALRNYHKEYNEKLQVYMDRPVHDWASHGSDAFGHFGLMRTRLSTGRGADAAAIRAAYNAHKAPTAMSA